MRIQGTCRNCGRELFPQSVIDAGGHCPWCGIALNRDYASLIVAALRQAEESGQALQDALEQIATIEDLQFDLDEETVLEPLRDALGRMRRRRSRV